MKHVMTSGAAAVALAASALFALPASADSPPVRAGLVTSMGDNSTLFIEVGHQGSDYRRDSDDVLLGEPRLDLFPGTDT